MSAGGLFTLILYVAIIGVFIYLLSASKKKPKKTDHDTLVDQKESNDADEENQLSPAESEAKRIEKKKENQNSMLNILLYFGSFLIISAVYLFAINTDGNLVAPITIILTTFFYLGGLLIAKYVDYLKNVGKAFCYTALIVLAFWTIPLRAIGLDSQSAWVITSIVSMISYSVAAQLLSSSMIPFFSYIWLVVLAYSFTPSKQPFNMYWGTLAPLTVAAIPAAFWLTKPSWLPVVFRKATQVWGIALLPIIYGLSLSLFLVPDFGRNYPCLRTIAAIILVLFTLAHFIKDHKHIQFIFCRFAVQIMILAATCDALNFSYITSALFGVNEGIIISMAIVWLICFLAQAIISVFIPKETEKDRSREKVVEVISLIGIFMTIIIVPGLSEVGATTLRLIIYAITSILGIVYSIFHRDSRWGFATIAGITAISIALTNSTLIKWTSWLNLLYYSVFGALVLGAYYFAKNAKYIESELVSMVGLSITGIALLCAGIDLDYIAVSWMVIAIYSALLGYMSKRKILYELSIYSGAFCLYSLVGKIGSVIEISNSRGAARYYNNYDCYSSDCIDGDTSSIELATRTIRSYIVPAALILAGFVNEREKPVEKRIRFIIGYGLLSLSLLFIGWNGRASWMLASLFTQIAFLVYAVLKDKSWIIWTSISALLISMISLTGGLNYIWFGVLGIILIAIVVWRLTKMHNETGPTAASGDNNKANPPTSNPQ